MDQCEAVVEEQEVLQEVVEDSALVDEVAVEAPEDSREEVREASHLEVEAVLAGAFLVDVVRMLVSLLVWITRRYWFIRGCTCKGCLGNNKIQSVQFSGSFPSSPGWSIVSAHAMNVLIWLGTSIVRHSQARYHARLCCPIVLQLSITCSYNILALLA